MNGRRMTAAAVLAATFAAGLALAPASSAIAAASNSTTATRTSSVSTTAIHSSATTTAPVAAREAGGSVASDTSDFRFASFDADYYLSRDSSGRATLKTVEKLVAVFPKSDQNKGIIRAIPDDYNGVPLHTKVVSISDSNGVTKPYSVDDDGSFTNVSTGTDDYVHGRVTYTLTYTQDNVAGVFADTDDDEFYWDTNGTGWDQPFAKVTARVHVDSSIASALTGHQSCYHGADGSTNKCAIAATTEDGAPIAFPQGGASSATPGSSATAAVGVATLFTASADDLGPNETMTVAIGFASGTFIQDPADTATGGGGSSGSGDITDGSTTLNDPLWVDILGGLLSLLALGGGVFAIVHRAAGGRRNAPGRGIIVPQYSVPSGINLMEASSLAGREASSIPAQIVSFAVRRNINILDYPVTASGADYTLQFLNADGVDPEEAELLAALFPDGLQAGALREIVSDSGLASSVARIKGDVRDGLIARGYRVRASSRNGLLVGAGLVALFVVEILAIIIAAFAAQAFSAWFVLAIPLTVIAAIVAFAVSFRPPVLTELGAETREYLLGMKEYLALAEKDRFRMLQSPTGAERIDIGAPGELVKLYEKLLPFAVLWGVEKDWTTELAVHYSQADATPTWYTGTSGFNSVAFAVSMAALSSSLVTSTTPVVTTSSSPWSGSGGGSSFGGSMGGGFSGGGGGGGGGGGR